MAKACSEFNIIQRYFAAGQGERDDVLLGVGDDAALLRVRGDSELAHRLFGKDFIHQQGSALSHTPVFVLE